MIKLLKFNLKITAFLGIIASIIFAFFGLVMWFAAKETIMFIAPIIVYSMAIFSIFSGLVATIIFSLERSEWLGVRKSEMNRDKNIAKYEGKLKKIEYDREHSRMIFEAKLLGVTVKQVERGMIHPASLGGDKFSSFPAAVVKHIEQAGVPLLEAPPQPLLPAIRDCDNVLIVGGKGSGKTTLLQWIEAERLQVGQTIALDSHAIPGQWAGQYVGAGRKYTMIKNAMIALVDKMDKRHEKRTQGETNFEPVHTMIDEFTLLPGYLKQADYEVQNYSFPMLTEGRKVEMNCLWGSHSDRAKPLGFEGMADLKECFDAIIYLKRVRGDFYALVDFGEGKENTRYALPGPFVRPGQNVQSPPTVTTGETDTAPLTFIVSPDPDPDPGAPTPSEMAAIEAFVNVRDSGKFSWRKATQAAYGSGKFGDGPNQNLRATLDKFGIDYSEYIT